LPISIANGLMGLASRSSLRPYVCRRRFASWRERPVERVCIRARTVSGGRLCHGVGRV
jgi:hypothetical protein